jgi:anti-anti-sigma regulatory factor
MATSEENDLIGYDPLAWMESDADKNEETNNAFTDSEEPEQVISSDEMTDADDLIVNAEESPVLNEAEDEPVIEQDDSEDTLSLIDESADALDAEDEIQTADAFDDTDVESVNSEDMTGALIDLDSTLSIQGVVQLHEKLKNSLAINDEIEINASDVSSIDTATLQLLVSLKKDAPKLQKKVTIIYPSPRFVESAKLLGLLDVLGVHDS